MCPPTFLKREACLETSQKYNYLPVLQASTNAAAAGCILSQGIQEKKISAEYPGAPSKSESGKEDVNGVDMQILKGKHFFFLEIRYFFRYYTPYTHICYLFVLLIVPLVSHFDIGKCEVGHRLRVWFFALDLRKKKP